MNNKNLDLYREKMQKLRAMLSGVPDPLAERKLDSAMGTVNMCLCTFERDIKSSLVPGSKLITRVNTMRIALSLLLQANGLDERHFTISRAIPDFKKIEDAGLYVRSITLERNDNDPDAVKIIAMGTVSPRGFVYVEIHIFSAVYMI